MRREHRLLRGRRQFFDVAGTEVASESLCSNTVDSVSVGIVGSAHASDTGWRDASRRVGGGDGRKKKAGKGTLGEKGLPNVHVLDKQTEGHWVKLPCLSGSGRPTITTASPASAWERGMLEHARVATPLNVALIAAWKGMADPFD